MQVAIVGGGVRSDEIQISPVTFIRLRSNLNFSMSMHNVRLLVGRC